MPDIGVLTTHSGFASTAFPVGSPQVSVLAAGSVLGSNIRLRVSYDVPSVLGGLAGLIPGLPRARVGADGRMRVQLTGTARLHPEGPHFLSTMRVLGCQRARLARARPPRSQHSPPASVGRA